MKRFSIFALAFIALTLPAFAQNSQLPVRDQERLAQRGGRHKGGKLKKLDTNQDGAIERAEWQGKPKKFDRLDANNDGRITREELKAARGKHGKHALKAMDANGDRQISRSEWTGTPELFSQLDANNDGVITKEEAKERHGKKQKL